MQDEVTIYRLIIVPLKGWKTQTFGKKFNKSKFYSGRNYEHIEVIECLLSFGAESCVLHFVIQKYKD